MTKKKLTIYKEGIVTIGETILQRQINTDIYGKVVAEYSPETDGWHTDSGFIESYGVMLDEMCSIAKRCGIEKLTIQAEERLPYEYEKETDRLPRKIH